jgi:hypothetical protein
LQRTSLRSPLKLRLGAPARRYTSARAVPSRLRASARTEPPVSRISASRTPAKHGRCFSTARFRYAGVAVLGTSPAKQRPDSRLRGRPVARSSPVSSRLPRSGAPFSWSLRLRRFSAQHPGSAQPRQRHRKRCNRRLHGVGRPQAPPTEGRSMPSFKAPSVSGSVRRTHRTYRAALGLSIVRRRPASASTRPVPIRSRLTPACSGLAALAADARR